MKKNNNKKNRSFQERHKVSGFISVKKISREKLLNFHQRLINDPNKMILQFFPDRF